MTSETKRYIDLSEIIGIRLQCKTCKCSLLVETRTADGTINDLTATSNKRLENCPTCGQPWVKSDLNQAPDELGLKRFLRSMRDLRILEKTFGCQLFFEIKEEGIKSVSLVPSSSVKD